MSALAATQEPEATRITVATLREWLENVDGDLEIRFEDQEGRLVGNAVSEAYRCANAFEHSAGERVYIVALEVLETDDAHEARSYLYRGIE